MANFEPGDAHRIQPALTLPLATDAFPRPLPILLRLHEAHPDEDWAGCLLHVYARGPSSLQREEALERLVDDSGSTALAARRGLLGRPSRSGTGRPRGGVFLIAAPYAQIAPDSRSAVTAASS